MRRYEGVGGLSRFARRAPRLAVIIVAWMALTAPMAAGDEPAAPAMDNAMSSASRLEEAFIRLESEAVDDVLMLPAAPAAIAREWRSFDREGSSLGTLISLGWVAVAALLALAAERMVARGLSCRLRRRMRLRPEGPSVGGLLLLLGCDIVALAVFAAVFIYSRHWLARVGVTTALIILGANVLIRWRIGAVIIAVLLRPRDQAARLLALPDNQARRLARFLSLMILAIVALVGFGRYGLMDEDSGAPHVVALLVVVLVCGLDTLMVFLARPVAEALIRGCGRGIVGALRAALARAWPVIGMAYVAGVFVFFVFGLTLGLLSYFQAAISTIGVLLVLLVLEQLTERGSHRHPNEPAGAAVSEVERLVEHAARRMLWGVVLLAAALTLAWVWIDAVGLPAPAAAHAIYSSATALGSLFAAYLAWELIRLAIDRHLHSVASGPRLPGDDDEAAPGSRLQTILPLVRAVFAAVIAIIAALTVLAHLGIDTAPLIAGAGVFGLAISFGAQSLVRDIISGLFYIWDDAFRVGEYIDTGRLKGTVEALGVRSIKLRHHNGPLHTIPYGQLGAVSNLSRDFATIKFNLRLEPGSDIELVRRTAKRIGLDMQQEPEIAAEVMLPLKMQGIAELADTAVVLRFKFTARPIKPTWVQREYVKRMYRVFAEKGIRFASGALTLQTLPPRPALGAPADGEAAALLFAETAAGPVAESRAAAMPAAQAQPA